MLTCLLEFSQIEQALAASMSAAADASQMQHRGGLGGNVAKLHAGSVSRDGSISARRGQDTGSYKSLARGASSGSGALGSKTMKNKQDAPQGFLPTYKTIDNLALDESLIGPKDAARAVEKSLPQGKECSRSKAKNLGNSLAALPVGNISYAYGSNAKVNYRKNVLARSQLVEMRQTLLDKCEEIVNSSEWPFGQFSLSTEKIFSDLLQYHGGESDGLNHSLGFR